MINEWEMAGRGTKVFGGNLPKCHITLLKGKMFTTPDPKQKTNKMMI
jgi:hypothetical protein